MVFAGSSGERQSSKQLLMWVEFDIPDLKKNPNKTKQESQSPQTGVDWQGRGTANHLVVQNSSRLPDIGVRDRIVFARVNIV